MRLRCFCAETSRSKISMTHLERDDTLRSASYDSNHGKEQAMNWKGLMIGAVSGLIAFGFTTAVVGAAEEKGATQTKTGTVKKVDTDAKQIVVMAARKLTFTITDNTKIQQLDKPVKLSDIKVDANVAVEYVKDGDKRTAKKIVLLKDK
jgi:archaeosine-15-forming tRNA-guanine transglycosylase